MELSKAAIDKACLCICRWLHPKQASIRELQVMTTPRSVLHGADNVIALLNGVAPHLRAVGIQAVLPAASMAALGQCRELVELHLDCELDFDLSVLSELRKLQRVVTFLPGMIPEDFPKGGQSLMPWLTSLPKLRELALQGVPRDFHTWVHRLTGLKDLKLQGYTSNTGFGTGVLQHGLSQLVCLTSLHVEGSEYLTIGDADTVMHAVARLGSLHRLTLANCTVVQEEAWCPSLARLSHTLTYLDLHEIWGLRNPMQLSSLVRLRCLHFSKPDIPGIAGIPAGFRSDVNAWSGVERLTLQNCDFTIWPKGLAFLQHLRHLDLSKNRLMAISAQLSRLTALSELILQGIDDLTVASSVVCSFAQLNLLDVRDCEPVVLEGSLPQLVRHVPVFLFTCIRTPAEQRKLGQPATWW